MRRAWFIAPLCLALGGVWPAACDVRSPALTTPPGAQAMETAAVASDAHAHHTNDEADDEAAPEIAPDTPDTSDTDQSPIRFHIGEPRHRYTLRDAPPLSEPSDTPEIITEHDADGSLRLRIPLGPDEAIWGFGQRFDAFNMRGRRMESWVTDGWNRLDTAYIAVPFYISSHGYGLLVNSTGRVVFDIGSERNDELLVMVPEEGAELITFHGTPAEVSRAYTAMVGRPQSAPAWIFRPWMSRNSYYGMYEINRMLRRMHELDMPVGVVVLEAWAEELHNFQFERRRYPYPITWIRRLLDNDVHVVCWITPSVWPDSEAHRQARDKGYLVLDEDGSEHVVRWLENGRKIDFRIPEARTWWRDLQVPLAETGISGIKTDGGEHMPDPVFRNEHPYHYQKASLDAFRAAEREGITFSRSGNPLTAGLSLVWAGDQYAEWSRLAAVVRAGLSAAFSGYPLWGHDIGAYSGVPEKDLYIRWLQFGAFSPIMQFHGEVPREPWHYDDETVDIARFYFAVRERLRPHLEVWAEEAITDGTPILRPLPWHYPEDIEAHHVDDQYLFGPDLLIAPLVTAERTRSVYLPEGDWVDLWNGSSHIGPLELEYQAPLHQIPAFVRADARETYQSLFDGAPEVTLPRIHVERVAPKDKRGIAREILFVKEGVPVEIRYRITNHTDASVPISARLAPPAGFDVEPRQIIRFALEAHESREVVYEVRPNRGTPPGTYPLTLEVRRGARDISTPPLKLAISPVWHVIGLFEGGVESDQPLDNEPADYDATHSGRNGQTVGWREVPPDAIGADGLIDLSDVLGEEGFSTSYLHTTIFAQWPRRARFRVGSGDAMTVWINGREALHRPVHRNPEADEDTIDTVLTGGINHVLIRISRDLAAHHVYFRIE